jgi:flagellar hook-length control protein FliK
LQAPPPLETATAEATLAAAAVSVPGAPTAEKPTTGFKTQVVAQAKSSATATVATTFGATDAPAQAIAPPAPTPTTQTPASGNAAPQPAANGKPDNDNAPAPAAKPDVAVSAAAPAASAAATHDHAAVTAGAQATIAPDGSAQAAALGAPLQPSTQTLITTASLTAAPAAAGAPVPVSGLAVEIAASVQSGRTRFELRLDPADLGRIDVRIDVDRSGQVTSHLTVEKPETLSMLRQDAPQLQQALNDAGLKTSSNGLQFSLRDQSASGQQNWQNNNQPNGNAQRLVVSEDTGVSASLAGQSYGRTLSASGGVDIRV